MEWLLRKVTSLENHDGNQPVRISVEEVKEFPSFISVVISYKRTDCEEYSPRMVLCSGGYHFFIYKGGRTKIVSDHSVGAKPANHMACLASLFRAFHDPIKLTKEQMAARMAAVRAAKK